MISINDSFVSDAPAREASGAGERAPRSRSGTARNTYSFSDVLVDFDALEVRREGRLLGMTTQELRILKYFLENPERVIARRELLTNVWGYRGNARTRTVDTHMLRLRRKLEPDPSAPRYFVTVHAAGYKFVSGDHRRPE